MLFSYSHGTSSILFPGNSNEVKQLNRITRIMNIAHNGSVEIRTALRRTTLFGRNRQSDFDDANRKKLLLRLMTMNVCKMSNWFNHFEYFRLDDNTFNASIPYMFWPNLDEDCYQIFIIAVICCSTKISCFIKENVLFFARCSQSSRRDRMVLKGQLEALNVMAIIK